MIAKKNILLKTYIAFIAFTLLLGLISLKLLKLQFSEGDKYRDLSEKLILRNDTIYATRGNIFASDGNLLAASMNQYTIHLDPVAIDKEVFKTIIEELSQGFANLLGGDPSLWERKIRKARVDNNQFLLIAQNLTYGSYKKLLDLPAIKKHRLKRNIIAEQSTLRVRPFGRIAERFVGYNRNHNTPGVEGAYDSYLKGVNGLRMKQRIAKGRWKPINSINQKEPIDGRDIITTIDTDIQFIAHEALLEQLEKFDADHGCAVVMETATGKIKAIANLGRNQIGKYYERLNYAVSESLEPGSSFKLMSLIAVLETSNVDTGLVLNTGKGHLNIYGRDISDSQYGGFGKISLARAFEVSSNTGFAMLVDSLYKEKPEKFLNALKKMSLDRPLGLKFLGEGKPYIPDTKDTLWSRNALPSISYGYNLELTPLQILTFYNAIANDGVSVKPQFVEEIREWNKTVKSFKKDVINKKICSRKTIGKVQKILKDVIKRGTGEKLYLPYLPFSGKTGTARLKYWEKDWEQNKKYLSSFVGYFPADSPKYSCIVMVSEPNTKIDYYGAEVAGPVFQKIAKQISNQKFKEVKVTNTPLEPEILTESTYQKLVKTNLNTLPDLTGMPVMDVLPLLENKGIRVQFNEIGIVKKQSIAPGSRIRKGQVIYLETS